MKMKNIVMAGLVVVISLAFINCANQNKKWGFKKIHFDFDKSYIRNDMIPVMDKNVAHMKKKKRHFSTESRYGHAAWYVTVEGHCDERGSNEYNLALGQRRAKSTQSYMVTHGISPSRLKTVSYGEEKPTCRDSNEGCWWKNRRAEFSVGH